MPAGSLDPKREYRFVVVLNDGQRLIPNKMTEERLNTWLRHPVNSFLPYRGSHITFTPNDIANIGLVEE
jgi:hypothetical protein